MPVYTREGDDGSSSLADGRRLPKDHPRFELLGALDEANSLIGVARHPIIDNEITSMLSFLQHRLLNCGAMVASAAGTDTPRVTTDDVSALEAIDRLAGRGGGFAGFVLPGCDETSAPLHVARAVMRRAERAAVTLANREPLDPVLLVFLNRASDLLYAAARSVGAGNDCTWEPEARPPRP
jgi:cob(I)alamin adenosyltransferase